VKYAELRGDIVSGDLLAWSHRGFGWNLHDLEVQAVRVFTRSEYCHVGIAWEIAGRVFALEAVQAGVRIFPLSRMLPFYWLQHDGLWTDQVEAYALEKVGQAYSKRQAIAAFLGCLKPGADDRWQCAEYAREILNRMGHAFRGVTPGDLVLELQRAGGLTHYVEAA